MLRTIAGVSAVLLTVSSLWAAPADSPALAARPGAKPRNIIYILADDHRYDAMGFMGHPFLKTPGMDRLAKGGAHLKNAFVTTALCSPSRASMLTGLYVHKHGVVDNNNPVRPDLIFFPQYLQKAGYQTAFIGKWHMGGDSDAPQRGFHHWVSFRGQGTYLPNPAGLNVDGKQVPQKGYITDELTDYAMKWLNEQKAGQPFFLYLSHKAVHAEFIPADRHKGKYQNSPVPPPASQASPADGELVPTWVKNQRNSWHGVEYPYHSTLDVADYYRRYCETLLAVDESIERILKWLEDKKLLESTLVVYMGDNGFMFGEHGLIDKRVAYEESMRVPLVMHCPELIKPGTVIPEVVANIDLAPTFLEVAGLVAPKHLDGKSYLPLLQGEKIPWRDGLLYEYYWERNFPQTPTMHAYRGARYKYIRYQGIWDVDELFDLEKDPHEMHNLIRSAEHQKIVREYNQKLFQVLKETEGLQIPLLPDRGGQSNLRAPGRSKAADFPSVFYEKK